MSLHLHLNEVDGHQYFPKCVCLKCAAIRQHFADGSEHNAHLRAFPASTRPPARRCGGPEVCPVCHHDAAEALAAAGAMLDKQPVPERGRSVWIPGVGGAGPAFE